MNRITAILALASIPAAFVHADSVLPVATGSADGPGFRVRADFSAPLNADRGWAGELNENVTVVADRPFRLRFEVEPPAGMSDANGLRLQYRRNGGEWIAVEAHDFPYPLREFEMDFAEAIPGSAPEGWRVVTGAVESITVVEDRQQNVLRAAAGAEALVALYPPPWELDEFSFGAEYRVGERSAAGLVFGFDDTGNHWRAVMDVSTGSIRVGRLVDGAETIVAERSAGLVAGEWQEIEVKYEAGMLEINFGDDALEFSEPVGSTVTPSDLGIFVPPGARVDFRGFVIEGQPSSPRVSIVSTEAYRDGEATSDLLQGAGGPFAAGSGINLAEQVPARGTPGGHSEFEWPLVIRRFADGAVTNDSGDTFDFRMTNAIGDAIGGPAAAVTLEVPAGHLGGTFVETPGRIGPWQAGNGDLYFIMEPAESDNLFMVVKSSDGGRSWREVDGANRPATGDLESVDAQLVGATLHMVHQVTEATLHHAFRTSDHPTHPDSWAVTDELATRVTARAQMASMAVRSDGSMVFFHVGDTIGYAVRSPAGDWSDEIVIDAGDGTPDVAGPQAVLGADDVVHLAYYRMDGTAWHRRLLPDNRLTKPQQLAAGLGTSEDDYGSVLPLVYLPQTDTVVIIYRRPDGTLWERRVSGDRLPSPAVRVTSRPVVQNAVDSQQVGADAVADGTGVRVLFIDESDRHLYSTHDSGGWQPAVLEVDDIDASWVRGSVYVRPDGVKVYGYAYDAGSQGGAGFNRFAEIVLGPE